MKTRFEELCEERRALMLLMVNNTIAMSRLDRLDQAFDVRASLMKKLARDRVKAMRMDKIAAE